MFSGTIKRFDIYPQGMLSYLTYVNLKQDYRMFYLTLTTSIHKNCLCTSAGISAMLLAVSMYRAGVGL